jgi:DNA-directed RNA polymerase subunit K
LAIEKIEEYTKFERARIISARALQIAMGSKIFIDPKGETDPILIATMEYEAGQAPIKAVRDKIEKISL